MCKRRYNMKKFRMCVCVCMSVWGVREYAHSRVRHVLYTSRTGDKRKIYDDSNKILRAVDELISEPFDVNVRDSHLEGRRKEGKEGITKSLGWARK